jgi:hypothetical protein
MELTKEEKAYLKALVEREAKHIKDEKKIPESSLSFIVAEEKMEGFITALLKKFS